MINLFFFQSCGSNENNETSFSHYVHLKNWNSEVICACNTINISCRLFWWHCFFCNGRKRQLDFLFCSWEPSKTIMILWIWNWVDIRRPNCNEILVTSGSKQCSSILSGKRAHTVVVYISYFGGNNSSDGAWFESQRWKSNRLFQNWHHGFFLMENGLESGISFLNSNAFSKTRTFLLLGDFMSSHQWAIRVIIFLLRSGMDQF